MKMPDKLYDWCKWICLIAIPAISTLYYTLSQIWGFPYGEEITATLSAVGLCIGSLIGLSHISIKKAEKEGDSE